MHINMKKDKMNTIGDSTTKEQRPEAVTGAQRPTLQANETNAAKEKETDGKVIGYAEEGRFDDEECRRFLRKNNAAFRKVLEVVENLFEADGGGPALPEALRRTEHEVSCERKEASATGASDVPLPGQPLSSKRDLSGMEAQEGERRHDTQKIPRPMEYRQGENGTRTDQFGPAGNDPTGDVLPGTEGACVRPEQAHASEASNSETMTFQGLIEKAHETARAKGFWDNERSQDELLMLMVSKLGEALEAHRKGKRVSSTACAALEGDLFSAPLFEQLIKDTFEDELADTIIRIADMCGGLGYNVDKDTRDPFTYGPGFFKQWCLSENVGELLFRITKSLCGFHEAKRADGYTILGSLYHQPVAYLNVFCLTHGIDLQKHIELKMRYNGTRTDQPFIARDDTAGRILPKAEGARVRSEQVDAGEAGHPQAVERETGLPSRSLKYSGPQAMRFNEGKLQWDLVDFESLNDLVRVLEKGATKYSKDNWKQGLPMREQCASMMRHLTALMSGEINDPESGLPHWAHIQCNAMFMAHTMKHHPQHNNLPTK